MKSPASPVNVSRSGFSALAKGTDAEITTGTSAAAATIIDNNLRMGGPSLPSVTAVTAP